MTTREWKSIPADERASILKRARKLVGFLPWAAMARHLDVGPDPLRRALDPDFAERDRLRARSRPRESNATFHKADSRLDASCVAARLAEIPRDTRTPAARILGEPIPSRSALAKARAARDWLEITPAERRENKQSANMALFMAKRRGEVRT